MKALATGVLFGLFVLVATAAPKPPVEKDYGVCRFILHDYEFSQQNQATINLIIDDLLKSHETAFEFHHDPNRRIRIRIFGREEDYNRFAETSQVGGDAGSSANLSTNVAGYYSVKDDEVITWRQHNPSYLANNILHECSHAIMQHQFRRQPIWLAEGCAVYFAYPRYMRDPSDEYSLHAKWKRIKGYMDENTLPDLREFLNIAPREFREMPPSRSYTLSWSLFQLLMSTPEKRQAMNTMLREYQRERRPDCAAVLDKAYPGGLTHMADDWRAWIARGAANVLGGQAE